MEWKAQLVTHRGEERIAVYFEKDLYKKFWVSTKSI